jgi:tetratricopeptide (TPR) repeat protein
MRLAISQGNALDREVELTKGDLQIGRAAHNDIVLPDPSQSVSRVHAKLQYMDGRYLLTDLDSANGTWVGERRVSAIQIEPGKPVTLGPYTLVLQSDACPWNEETMPWPDKESGATAPAAATQASRVTVVQKVRDRAGLNLPRPILVGGLAACLIGAMVLGRILVPVSHAQRTIVAGGVPRKAPSAGAAERVQQHIAEAKLLLARREFDGAVEQLEHALFMEPANAEVLELKMKAAALRAEAGAFIPQPPPMSAASRNSREPVPPSLTRAPRAERKTVRRTTTESRVDLSADRLKEPYERAKSALEAGAIKDAVAILEEIERDEPQYRDVPALLQRARDERRSMARQSLEDAEKLEAAGQLSGALTQFEAAQQHDSSTAPVVEDAIRRVSARMKSVAADAFARAKMFDAYGRIQEAVAMYERAYSNLPDADPRKKAVKDRLEVLGGRQ